MLALLLSLAALAEPVGFAHPADLVEHSALYTKAAEKAGATFQEREATSEALGLALDRYETALHLLGDRAPEVELERLAELRKQFNRERAVLQAFAQAVLEDFDQEFTRAMKRAMPEGATLCRAEKASGTTLPGMPTRTAPNPDCEGPDLNRDVAVRMDSDPALTSVLDEILAAEWPEFSLDTTAQAPIGGAPWIQVEPFFQQIAASRLKAIARADEEARIPLASAIEEGADKEALQELQATARAITQRTADARASLGDPVFDVVEKRASKYGDKGSTAPGWCANPERLGGCTGEPAPAALARGLQSDKKVGKALR